LPLKARWQSRRRKDKSCVMAGLVPAVTSVDHRDAAPALAAYADVDRRPQPRQSGGRPLALTGTANTSTMAHRLEVPSCPSIFPTASPRS
jgi:hypothetical protein